MMIHVGSPNADLCGNPQLGTVPYGPNAAPYDPRLVMEQYWENFELQLRAILLHRTKAAILSGYRQMIEQGLAPYPPEQQQEVIQLLEQTMSPELSEVLLPT